MEKHEEAQAMINKLIQEDSENLGEEIFLLNADIVLKLKDIKKAVNLLKKINPSNPGFFISSRKKLADIYITHLKDRRLFSWCYSEILENVSSLT